ncbi:MAG TPA: hypothetical protein VGP79_06805 [Bryobacteraceae bacterium]|nr:hypothetical protein [Bryobacteraceae bacterium]
MRKFFHWEFWPIWAAYAPLMPYLLTLAIRYRSLTLFTAANPGIATGGFVDESKSEILAKLSTAGCVAECELIPTDLSPEDRIEAAQRFIDKLGLTYPVILKPDMGERGSGVAVIRSTVELANYLGSATEDIIIQRYVDGAEFGVFYYRYPYESRGRIFSITVKQFPEVTGDGISTVDQLILRDPRASMIANTYRKLCRRSMSDVPVSGERVRLVELGTHSRGAIFLNGQDLHTPALEQAVDLVSKAHPGFFFGRFDVRTPSAEALQRGEFQVIELNGVSAEATHIYDPSVSVWQAYRTLAQQWRIAFEIADENRKRGAKPMSIAELRGVLRARSQRLRGALPQVPVQQLGLGARQIDQDQPVERV